jgi:hypothetical protein
MTDARDISADEDFFEMVNIYPADSGLPMVVWASERGHARHDVRIKVNQSHGTRMLPGNLATVAVRPAPRLMAGQLSAADLQVVSEWIRLNETALVAHWNYQISGIELGRRLQRLPAASAGAGLGSGHAQPPPRRMTTLHTITWVKPAADTILDLAFEDKSMAEVDLAPLLAPGAELEPLREHALFYAVEIGNGGHIVLWRRDEDVVAELSADTLWRMTHPEGRPGNE